VGLGVVKIVFGAHKDVLSGNGEWAMRKSGEAWGGGKRTGVRMYGGTHGGRRACGGGETGLSEPGRFAGRIKGLYRAYPFIMPVFLNNCDARPHAEYYPPDGDAVAFFDLDTRGPQGKALVRLLRGTECIVASPEGTRDIRFNWFVFSHEALRPAPEGTDVRVLFGRLARSDVMPKVDATQRAPYSTFFTSEGNFRHGSVIASTP
jgi:hypothetical protein